MVSVSRTAYPRFAKHPNDEELEFCYSLSEAEQDFIRCHARGDSGRLTLAVMLKARQQLGCFPVHSEVPDRIREHLCMQLGVSTDTAFITESRQNKTIYRYRRAVRTRVGSKAFTDTGRDCVTACIRDAAYTMSDPADLINIAVEELFKTNSELPAFSTLARLCGRIRQEVHEKLYIQITATLNDAQRSTLDSLLRVEGTEQMTMFARLKQSPGPATLKHIRLWAERMTTLGALLDPSPFIDGISYTKIRQFAAEATALQANDLRNFQQLKRYTLLLCYLYQKQSDTRDQLTSMLVKRMGRTRNAAQKKLRDMQDKYREKEEALIGILGNVLHHAENDVSDDTLGKEVRQVLETQGGIDAVLAQYEEVTACHQNNYLPLLWPFHSRYRTELFQILELLTIESATQDTSLLKALHFVRQHRHTRKHTVPSKISLSFTSQRWKNFIQTREKKRIVFNRKALEVCVFMYVAEALHNNDLYVVGSGEYADYRKQLMPWEECQEPLVKYCNDLELPLSGNAFIVSRQQKLIQAAAEVDRSFPKNSELAIDADGVPHLKRQKAQSTPDNLKEFEAMVRDRMPERHVLDVLRNVHHWIPFTRHFGPLSGSNPKLSNATLRYLFTVFGYGSFMGATQTAGHAPEIINRHTMRRINTQHINAVKLEAASNDIIGEYALFELPKCWGDGKTAIADGTHMKLRENNLMGERHIRYGGYGGIAYHHISDTYVALFSHFIACGVWEAVYILDGLLKNKSAFQPDTLHADTHGQSEAVFGLAHLLGIKLFPRMRNWNDVIFYKADSTIIYKHIDALFTKTIDWKLIETHWEDMMQVVLSIQAGKVLPSMLLRRLNSNNRKNKLYRAFRELGRVERTLFLLRYISEAELRQTIQAETTKIESHNNFLDWITFGGDVIKSGDPVEQEKQIKYTNLIANAIMLHNVVDMTEVLSTMEAEGYPVTKELAACLSPTMHQKLKRFGKYAVDMEKHPPPLRPKPLNFYT